MNGNKYCWETAGVFSFVPAVRKQSSLEDLGKPIHCFKEQRFKYKVKVGFLRVWFAL